MISKIGAAVLVVVAAMFFAAPANVFAASSNKTQVAKLLKQLKKLPNKGATPAQVTALVTKLTKLDPVKANTYVKTGLTKLDPVTSKATVDSLGKKVSNIVEKSDLPESAKKGVLKKSDKTIQSWVPAEPTPTPYQAMILVSQVVA